MPVLIALSQDVISWDDLTNFNMSLLPKGGPAPPSSPWGALLSLSSC